MKKLTQAGILHCSRNYNPVERRCKVGKERNLRGSHKSSKSLQANSLPNRASIDGGSLSSSDFLACFSEIELLMDTCRLMLLNILLY